MPIYTTRVTPWVLVNKMNPEHIMIFKRFIRQAMQEFDYRYDIAFADGIELNQENKDPYLARYNIDNTGLSKGNFMKELQALIMRANVIKTREKKFELFKFDIMGDWEYGYIILMRINRPFTEEEIKKLNRDLKIDSKNFIFNFNTPVSNDLIYGYNAVVPKSMEIKKKYSTEREKEFDKKYGRYWYV